MRERQGAGGKKRAAEYDPKFARQRGGPGKETAKRVGGAIGDLLASEGAGAPGAEGGQ